MLVSFIRTIIIYLVITAALRIMGKRQIGELSPAEFIITILVSEFASIPLQDAKIPLYRGIIPILTLISLEIVMSSIFLKSRVFRKIAIGRISILIENGNLNQKEMRKLRLTLDELLEELRLKGFIDIKEVKYAILESNGELSVFPFSKDAPATKSDLGIEKESTYLPHTIISDGLFIKSEAQKLNLKRNDIEKELTSYGVSSISDVFLMQADGNGGFLVIPKENSSCKKVKRDC